MNIAKHTLEVIERIQAHELMSIIMTADTGIAESIEQSRALEDEATSFLDMRPTEEIMKTMSMIQAHQTLCEEAKRFAVDELQEIGYYLN
jgi:hypothetical protein